MTPDQRLSFRRVYWRFLGILWFTGAGMWTVSGFQGDSEHFGVAVGYFGIGLVMVAIGGDE